MKNGSKLLAVACVGIMAAGTATADTINGTYVGATVANTFKVGDEGADILSSGWADSLGEVDGATGFNPVNGPNAATLVTRITGLNPGDVYEVGIVYSNLSFFANTNISGGLTANSLVTVPGDAYGDALTDILNTGSGTSYDMALGEQTVDALGNLEVFVKDGGTNFASTFLAYNGITYNAVPEPSSLALLGLGGLAMLRRRR